MNSCLLRKHKYSLLKSLSSIESDIEKIDNGKKRILYITPHLSTGGMPQYLLKKIQLLYDVADIYCVQWVDNAPIYTVQRDQIRDLLNDKFYCLGNDKNELFDLINNIIFPDIIHFEDLPERFIPMEMIEILYSPDRPYFICETPHSSTIGPSQKSFLPDKFIMVNEWMIEKYKELPCQFDLLEYPIEDVGVYDKLEYQRKLELDPNKKHIINVGLFTPGKNQTEVINIAREVIDLPIQFHFIGNLASNFIEYWNPITEDLPENCKIWGERSDVEDFYKAADLFLFTSNWELNPITIKESLSNRLPIMMYKLPSYLDDYDNNEYVTYLNVKDRKTNIKKMLEVIELC